MGGNPHAHMPSQWRAISGPRSCVEWHLRAGGGLERPRGLTGLGRTCVPSLLPVAHPRGISQPPGRAELQLQNPPTAAKVVHGAGEQRASQTAALFEDCRVTLIQRDNGPEPPRSCMCSTCAGITYDSNCTENISSCWLSSGAREWTPRLWNIG